MTESLEWWPLGLAFNAIIGMSYFAIAWSLLTAVDRNDTWRTNPLGVATGAIFLTCAMGHAFHTLHLMEPGAVGEASRFGYDGHMLYADAATATVGVWYWTLRRKFPSFTRRGSPYDRSVDQEFVRWLIAEVIEPLEASIEVEESDRRGPTTLHHVVDEVTLKARARALQYLETPVEGGGS